MRYLTRKEWLRRDLDMWREANDRFSDVLARLRSERVSRPEDVLQPEDTSTPTLDLSVWSNRSGSDWERNVDKWADTLVELGFAEVALMTESQRPSTYSLSKYRDAKQLIDVSRKLVDKGVRVVLVSWTDPVRKELDDIVDGDGHLPGILDLARDCGASGVEWDCEGGNWSGDYVKGFKDLDEASYYLRDRIYAKRDELGMTIRISADTHHGRTVASYKIITLFDEFATQTYSKYDPDEPDRWWGAKYGPGNFQRTHIAKARALQDEHGRPEIIAGLASWNQSYPEHAGDGRERGGAESMLEAMKATIETGIYRIRFWKWKSFREPGYQQEAIKLIRSMDLKEDR